MEYYNEVVCVTREDLIGGEDPVMSVSALEKMVGRKRIQVMNRGGGECNRALYAYPSLPRKYREAFEQRFGNPEALLKKQEDRTPLPTDTEAQAFFEAYTYEKGGRSARLDEGMKAEYTLNASVLRYLMRKKETIEREGRRLGNHRTDTWTILLASCERLRDEYGHTLPGTAPRIRKKMKDLREQGYSSLLSGKLGNTSTTKIGIEEGRLLVALKRSKVPVYTNRQIFDEYNRQAEKEGRKPLKSVQSVTDYLNRPEVKPLWFDAAYGELESRQVFNRLHRTELPQMRDALWYGDGTKLNLYYRDDRGKVRTVQVYEVIDAYSEVLLGFHISETEDYEAQYHAYRMAVQTARHKPYEIVHDNQGGHKRANSAGMLDRICHIHRTTAPYSGQSKTIESVFGRFQSQVLHRRWAFTGMNITAKSRDSRPNLEFTQANRDSLPTLGELKEEYVKARQEWNEAKHPATGVSRMEMYEKSANPEAPEVTAIDMVEMFWTMTSRPSRFTASGIEITVGGRKMAYEVFCSPGVPDLKWRRENTTREFYVKYDPYDLQTVRLYYKDSAGKLRFETEAKPYMVIHRAIQEQTKGEMAFIRQQQEAAALERIERQASARAIEHEHGTAPEQHGLVTPELKGLTAAQKKELERRTRKYDGTPEELEIGRYTKRVSNLQPELADGTIEFDFRRAAGKL